MVPQVAVLLPYLALAGLVLEAAPVNAAHGLARHPRRADRSVARDFPAYHNSALKRHQGGKKCRVRPAPAAAAGAASAGAGVVAVGATAPVVDNTSSDQTGSGSGDSSSGVAQPQENNGGSDISGNGSSTAGDGVAPPASDSPSATSDSPSATSEAPAAPTSEPQNTPDAPAPSDTPAANKPAEVPSAPPASGSSVNGGTKFGLAWPNGDWYDENSPTNIKNFIGSKASWYYTWKSAPDGAGDRNGLEYVPMLWGADYVSGWHSDQASWGNNVRSALFFNEPNQHGQAHIAAGDAVQYWMNDFLPVRHSRGLRLGAAGCTSAPDGLTWALDFYNACVGAGNSAADCSPDFQPTHYYDVSVEGFKTYHENFHQQTGKNLWVTEYACQNFNGGAQCSADETWNFHTQVAQWMDSQDWIERYSPFGPLPDLASNGVNTDNALMTQNGDKAVSPLGSWYANSS